MRFDGSVQDLGGTVVGTSYELAYRGKEVEGLRKFLMEEVRRKGLEVAGRVVERREGEGWVVGVQVRSERGII